MMRTQLWVGFTVVIALAVLVVAGCGGGGSLDSGLHGTLTPRLVGTPDLVGALAVTPYPGAGQWYRYCDMLDHFYLGAPLTGTYDGQYDPAVPPDPDNDPSVDYDLTAGTTLAGTITATGMQAHFAYQVKLEGNPTDDPDDPDMAKKNWSNDQIGSIGRWWCADCLKNLTDAELLQHADHRVLGYLLFDFFMTDINGDAAQDLWLDSSFHVLWRTDQRRPNPARDGKPRSHTVTWGAGVYPEPSFDDQEIQVYAEGETSRPKPGQVTLPAGDYACRLLITEESFHNAPPTTEWPYGQTHYENGGFWAHAMSDGNFQFTITGGTPPPTGTIKGTVTYADTGKPARRVTVTLSDGPSAPQTALTGGKGQYSFEGLEPGTYTVSASDGSSSSDDVQVALGPGETKTQDLVLY